jgi:PBP1b-binding outer membrane lipoprotein LpoB
VTTISRLLGVTMLSLFVTGCSGGGAEVKSNIQTTTQGQQPLDLKKAYDAGAMSKEEYERLRKKIVEDR